MKIHIGRDRYLSFSATTLIGADPATWLGILWRYGRGMSWPFIPKAIILTWLVLLNTPLVWWERLRYDRRIRRAKVTAPLFIIGHQRSGTTYLHYLIGKDPQFGYLSVKESFMPWLYLTLAPLLRRMYAKALPDKRPMDDLRMGVDLPTEPEYSLGNMTASTMIPGYYFPRRMLEVFRRNVLFEDERARKAWQRTLRYFMQKLTLRHGGKPLVLKSPENLARVKEILEVFPDARFLHIMRDPYRVFFSTERLYGITLPLVTMQHVKGDEVEEALLESYRLMFAKFFRDKAAIPVGQLAEVRYEDLIGNEEAVLEKAYAQLGLGGFEAARPHILAEVKSYAGYRTNTYAYPPERMRLVRERWGPVFDALGYPKDVPLSAKQQNAQA
ncbi:MAG: sulfotransferase [Flavobacteriales bacterium]|nr:sulfotransferase [Flavobacteriales bacterium]